MGNSKRTYLTCCLSMGCSRRAVLVAGSSGYGNYRHQSDICHAYQVALKNGVDPDKIITMIYNDVANDSENPFAGKLYNKPTAQGTPGVDVYAGCNVTYSGDDVTADNFLAVLAGNASGITCSTGGCQPTVLGSTADDTVFVYFSDHGAAGLVAMPSGPYLYAADLSATIKYMRTQGMFRKLVLYIEACESGSM